MPKQTSWLTWIIAIPLAYIVFSCTYNLSTVGDRAAERISNMTPEQKAEALAEVAANDAKYACRDIVEATLKAPATATFPYYKDFVSRPNGPNEYVISGYVDSQNSFGAMIRTSFDCNVKKSEGEAWRLLSLQTN